MFLRPDPYTGSLVTQWLREYGASARRDLLELNRVIGDLPVHSLGLAYEVALVILRIYSLPIAPEGLNGMLVQPQVIVPELWSANGLD